MELRDKTLGLAKFSKGLLKEHWQSDKESELVKVEVLVLGYKELMKETVWARWGKVLENNLRKAKRRENSRKLKIGIYPNTLKRPAVRRDKLLYRLAKRSQVSLRGQSIIIYYNICMYICKERWRLFEHRKINEKEMYTRSPLRTLNPVSCALTFIFYEFLTCHRQVSHAIYLPLNGVILPIFFIVTN